MKVKYVSFSNVGSTKNYSVPVYKLYEPFLVSTWNGFLSVWSSSNAITYFNKAAS